MSEFEFTPEGYLDSMLEEVPGYLELQEETVRAAKDVGAPRARPSPARAAGRDRLQSPHGGGGPARSSGRRPPREPPSGPAARRSVRSRLLHARRAPSRRGRKGRPVPAGGGGARTARPPP